MNTIIVVVVFCICTVVALPAPQLFPGSNSTNHGDPNLSCTPTRWTDIAIFFIGNYVAHAATVKSYPGEGGTSMLLAMLGALLLPTSGLIRGLNGIIRNGKFLGRGFGLKKIWAAATSTPDYQTAAASGALCMLVRTPKWQPRERDEINEVILRNRYTLDAQSAKDSEDSTTGATFVSPTRSALHRVKGDISADPELEVPRELKIYRPPWMLERCSFWTFSDSTRAFVSPDTTVHGSFDLKDAKEHYALAPVPRDAVIVPPSAEVTATAPVIAASYSFPSALIAVLQFMYAVVTLIETIRGAQITTYGYAAFGLTVVPYAMMSLVNLMSALATPAYATMLMVRNEVMEEAEKRHEAQFDGVVGSLVPDPMPQMDVARVSGQASVSPPTEPSSNEKPTPEIVEESDPPSLMQFSCRHDGDATNYIYQVRQSDSRLGDMLSAPRKIAYDTSPSVFVPSCSRFRRFMFDIDTVDPTCLSPGMGGVEFKIVDAKVRAPLGNLDKTFASIINGLIIIAVIGGLTHFRKAQSTHAQRSWLMIWYVFGFVIGGIIGEASTIETRKSNSPILTLPIALAMLLYGIPSIGGFVVVAQMLWNYGICTGNS